MQKIAEIVLTNGKAWNIIKTHQAGNAHLKIHIFTTVKKSFKKLLTKRNTYDTISELPLRTTATQNLDK